MSEKKFNIGHKARIIAMIDEGGFKKGDEGVVTLYRPDSIGGYSYRFTNTSNYNEIWVKSSEIEPIHNTPTAQWQKEAEEMALTEHVTSEYTRGVSDGIDIGKEQVAIEHTAHLSQLQGEILQRTNNVAIILASYGIELPEKCINEINTEMEALRTITQTKTDKG